MLTKLRNVFGGQSRSPNFVFKTRRFYDIRLQKHRDLEMLGQRSLKVIESGIIR